ncbi:hypothetical protein BDF19DRAFT_436128 [Syncephalis fuscata]|nr:hypothetical protein BDF19DRAFT_436128 [Syncephalis fuscata]
MKHKSLAIRHNHLWFYSTFKLLFTLYGFLCQCFSTAGSLPLNDATAQSLKIDNNGSNNSHITTTTTTIPALNNNSIRSAIRQGCFQLSNPTIHFDALGQLDLPDPEAHQWMTPTVCQQHCRRFYFQWALIYHGNNCRCAHDYAAGPKLSSDKTVIKVADNKCSAPCSADLYYLPLTTAFTSANTGVAMAMAERANTTSRTAFSDFSSLNCAAITSGASVGTMFFTVIACTLFYWCYLRPSLIDTSNQHRYGNNDINASTIANKSRYKKQRGCFFKRTHKQSSTHDNASTKQRQSSKGSARNNDNYDDDSHDDDDDNDGDDVASSNGKSSNSRSGFNESYRGRRRCQTSATDKNMDEVNGASRWWTKHIRRDRSKTLATTHYPTTISPNGSGIIATVSASKSPVKSPHHQDRNSSSSATMSTAPSEVKDDDYSFYYGGEESDDQDGRKGSFHVDRRAVLRGIEAGQSPYGGVGARTAQTATMRPQSYDEQNGGVRRSSLNDVFPPLHNLPPCPENQDWYDLRPVGPAIGSIASDLHDSLDYTPRLRIANPSRRYSSGVTGDSSSEMSSYTCMTNKAVQ